MTAQPTVVAQLCLGSELCDSIESQIPSFYLQPRTAHYARAAAAPSPSVLLILAVGEVLR